jgi:hypothetical protein
MRRTDRCRGHVAWERKKRQSVAGLVVLIALGLVWWGISSPPLARPLVGLAAFVGLAEVAALGGMLVVRRAVPLATLEAHKEYAGFVYATLGAAYAVLLSFMVVVSWNQYGQAQQTTMQEAITMVTLFHLAEGFEEPIRTGLKQTLLAYNQAVLDEEWAAMARGGGSEWAWALSDKLWDTYIHIVPSQQAQAAYTQSLTGMQQLYTLRAQRLLQSRSHLPAAIWVVLATGAIITVAFTYLFGVSNVYAQAVMTAALTAIIAGSLYLIFDLDTPYSGPLHIDAVPYQSDQRFFTPRLHE